MDEKKVREAIKALKITIDIGKQKIEHNKTFEPKKDNEPIEKSVEHAKTAIKALEKQLPKKADIMDYVFDDINFRCPVCKSEYICEKEHEHFYCPTCGQKLDWTVEE